jgi:hypothetical protein
VRILYLVFGLLLLGSTAISEYRGWILPRPNTVTNVPRSVRDNPGAWRSIYRGSPRFFGGK